jgi:threonyl-tRNA synthetase
MPKKPATFNKIENMRHSLAHLLAATVLKKFPDAKLGIGPIIENGFYYDFLLPRALTPDDLKGFEKTVREFIRAKLPFSGEKITTATAKKLFKNQPFKLELIKEYTNPPPGVKKRPLTIYITGKVPRKSASSLRQSAFIDLCAGGHVKNTREIPVDAFRLDKIAGAYWRGSEKNPQLQRIYGLAFESKKQLNEFLKLREEAEKRDHRLIGQKLDLFSIDEEVGAGLVLWHPKGALLRQIIEDYWIKEHLANGYELVKSPHIGRIKLWQTSGHTSFYKENMFGPMEVEGDHYLIKPMNCPFHMKIYKSRTRSYRDLPLRWAELGTVYRYERSGVLHGLTRVRGFTQDDAHIICTPEQLTSEVMTAVKFGTKLLGDFGFKQYGIYLATRPEKFVGTPKNWERAINTLKYALNKLKLKYQIDEGGGVFYGPKIDIKIKDSLGREWQCTTVQFDFNLPERFNLVYIGNKGKKQRPYMVHRALLGSLERFVGVLLEHFAGAFPLWLAPVQAEIINVGSAQRKYAAETYKKLAAASVRTKLSDENLTVGKRIRDAEIMKIPYILVVGEREEKNGTVNVRHYRRGQEGEIKIEKLSEKILAEIKNKTI